MTPAQDASPRRVLILWTGTHSANLGVRVLGQGVAALARTAWGHSVQIDFQDYGPGDSSVGFGGRSIARDFLRRSGPITAKIRQYDAVLDTGAGDSFADIYGLKRLAIMAYTHRRAARAHVPVIMTPQTIGPFATLAGRRLARGSLKRMTHVIARDEQSAALALKLGRRATLATDVVFALEQPRLVSPRDIVLNVSGLLWRPNPHVNHERYQREVRSLIGGLLDRGRTVTLLAHVLDNPTSDNDAVVARELEREYGGLLEAIVPNDLDEARSVLCAAHLVVGSRMHACLNAMSTGTPSIPWAYSRKFAPLFAELGWNQVLDLRTNDPIADRTLEMIGTEEQLAEGVEEVVATARRRLRPATAALRSIF